MAYANINLANFSPVAIREVSNLHCNCSCMHAEIPAHHSYYFTTHILHMLVLKFTNKGIFFEEIHHSHLPRKRGYFGTHLHEFGGKWVNFDVKCLL